MTRDLTPLYELVLERYEGGEGHTEVELRMELDVGDAHAAGFTLAAWTEAAIAVAGLLARVYAELTSRWADETVTYAERPDYLEATNCQCTPGCGRNVLAWGTTLSDDRGPRLTAHVPDRAAAKTERAFTAALEAVVDADRRARSNATQEPQTAEVGS